MRLQGRNDIAVKKERDRLAEPAPRTEVQAKQPEGAEGDMTTCGWLNTCQEKDASRPDKSLHADSRENRLHIRSTITEIP
jgi:hypothetical protein